MDRIQSSSPRRLGELASGLTGCALVLAGVAGGVVLIFAVSGDADCGRR